MKNLMLTNQIDPAICVFYALDGIQKITTDSLVRFDGTKFAKSAIVLKFKDGADATFAASNWSMSFN